MPDTITYTESDKFTKEDRNGNETSIKNKFKLLKFINKKLFRTQQNPNRTTVLSHATTNTSVEPIPSSPARRDEWTNKVEYMLSVVGYVVDLGNCVRFPYMTYKNGGGAFLIPYFIFLFLIGTPMMYLEMSVGQFFRTGNITLWSKMSGYMKGIKQI